MNTNTNISEKEKALAWFDAGFSALGKRVLRLGALALLVYVVLRSHSIVVTLIMAGILACAASGAVDWLCRQRLLRRLKPHGRRGLVSALVLATIVGLVIGSGNLFLSPIQNELRNFKIENYKAEFSKKMEETQDWYSNLPDWLHDLVTKQAPAWVNNLLTPPAEAQVIDPAESLLGSTPPVQPTPVPAPPVAHVETAAPGLPSHTSELLLGFLGKLGGVLNGIVELILLPVLAFYFLVEGHALRNELVRFVPADKRRAVLAMLRESAGIMRSYLLAQLALAVIAGVVVGTMLACFKIPNPLILAVVAAVTRAVPVIGPLLGGIPIGLIVFVECSRRGDYTLLVVIMTIFTLTHLLESKLLTPFILGKGLNLHPIIIIVALLIGGEFFGLLGMFLAAPVTALVRTVLLHLYVHPKRTHFRNTSRLGRALGQKKE